MNGYSTIPYVIAFSNELVEDPIWFEPSAGSVRLAYRPARDGDWVGPGGVRRYASGILRARVRDLLDRPDERGHERMRKLNTLRQWRCMDHLFCQVCGQPAIDLGTGRTPWLLVRPVFEATGAGTGRTNAPPCCWACVPKALEECKMLRAEPVMLCTVGDVTSAGVLADIYQPMPDTGQPVPCLRNAFVAWSDHIWHAGALAVAQVVDLHGIEPVGLRDGPALHGLR